MPPDFCLSNSHSGTVHKPWVRFSVPWHVSTAGVLQGLGAILGGLWFHIWHRKVQTWWEERRAKKKEEVFFSFFFGKKRRKSEREAENPPKQTKSFPQRSQHHCWSGWQNTIFELAKVLRRGPRVLPGEPPGHEPVPRRRVPQPSKGSHRAICFVFFLVFGCFCSHFPWSKKITQLQVSATLLRLLGDTGALQRELPDYKAAATGCEYGLDVLDWWRKNGTKFPAWRAAAKKIFAIAPTSAAAERVFSLLNGAVSDRQEGLLDDHLEAMLLLRFNEEWRQKEKGKRQRQKTKRQGKGRKGKGKGRVVALLFAWETENDKRQVNVCVSVREREVKALGSQTEKMKK